MSFWQQVEISHGAILIIFAYLDKAWVIDAIGTLVSVKHREMMVLEKIPMKR